MRAETRPRRCGVKVRRLKEDIFHLRFDASETVGLHSRAWAASVLPPLMEHEAFLFAASCGWLLRGSSFVVSLCCTWRLVDWCFLGKQMLLVSLVRVTSGGWGRLPPGPSAVVLCGVGCSCVELPHDVFSVLTEVCFINACETQNPTREHRKADKSAEETA